jgi:hypothetical protein
MKTYRLSATGRRLRLILLVSALAIWGFALWSLRSTLDLSYNPLEFWGTLSASFAQGLSISQAVPALLMLVLIVATPLVFWNVLEEWAASYTPTDEGLRFASLGISVLYPWESIEAVRRVDDDSDDPLDEVLLRDDHTGQIGNPLLRWLHAQAYGRRKLPIYAGLEERNQLLAEIKQRAGLLEQAEEPAPANAAV